MLPPKLCLGPLTGVTPPPPIDIREGFGVVVLPAKPLTDTLSEPERASFSCLAVIPTYLLARDPAVILLSMALVLVLVPKRVFRGGEVSSKPIRPLTEVDTARETRRGVVVVGLGRAGSTFDGVCRPESWKDAFVEARDRCEEATEGGRDGPEVGAESLESRVKTPHIGEHEKY